MILTQFLLFMAYNDGEIMNQKSPFNLHQSEII